MRTFTRRAFLKQAAAGTAGLAFLAACQKAPGSRDAALSTLSPAPLKPTIPPTQEEVNAVTNADRAKQTYSMLVKRFAAQPDGKLFYEHVQPKPEDPAYSYLWPYSSVVSAANALARMPKDGANYNDEVKLRLDGLNAYYDKYSDPTGYDSYIIAAGGGDKFYDDNEWLGLDFVEAYRTLKDSVYLDKAKEIWKLTISGWDEKRGGIFWKQNDQYPTRNTCSNGPAAVLAMLLYEETKEAAYLEWAKKIMTWLEPLRSPDTGVYWDHVTNDGSLDKRTYTYNTGTPIHAYALLYKATGDASYLKTAQSLAAAAYEFFAKDNGSGLRIYPDTPWFNAILLRGYIALQEVDPAHDLTYIQTFQKNLDFAWENARGTDGGFTNDWTGKSGVTSDTRALIDQGAMVELYARLSRYQA